MGEVYGLIPWASMKLNAVVVLNIIMDIGISIEFLCHISRSFMLSAGTLNKRVRTALRHMGMPILNGGFTTFLGVLCIGFSEYDYFRKYFFFQYLVILGVGVVNESL